MTNNSGNSERSYNNNNNNATNSCNKNNNNEQSQPIPSTMINNEVVMAISQPNNDVICTISKDVMRSQVQTSTVETTLPQSNLIANTNIPPFLTTRPWGMPQFSTDMNIPQLSMPMPQSQPVMPPIMVNIRTNRNLELGGSSHGYGANQLRNMEVPTEDMIVGDSSMIRLEFLMKLWECFR